MPEEIGTTVEDMEQEEMQRGVFTRQDYRLVKYLLEEIKGIPDEIKKQFWVCFSRTMVLTNLNDKDIRIQMMRFHDMIVNALMSVPHYRFTFNMRGQMNQLEQLYFCMLKRSSGGTQRERWILGAQIQQRIVEGTEEPRGGIVHRLKGFFGLGRR